MNRSELKKTARKTVKNHYFLLVLLAVLSIFIGTEFNDRLSNAQSLYNTVTGRETDIGGNALKAVSNSTGTGLLTNAAAEALKAGKDRKDSGENSQKETGQEADKADEKKDSGEVGKENGPEEAGNAILGRRKGILAGIVNSISSGKLEMKIAEAINSVVHSSSLTTILMILGSLCLYGAFWIFGKNMIKAVSRRAVLEAGTYEKVPVGHLLYFRSVGRWVKTAWTLCYAYFFESLWSLTIIGWPIKHYAYFMVPYIAAENPDVKARDALKLSVRMMHGHKWECFLLDLSLFGWTLLGIITFGISDVFWGIPYKMAVHAEYFKKIRAEAIEKQLQGTEVFNDPYLYEFARRRDLSTVYQQVQYNQMVVMNQPLKMSKLQAFFADNFGIWLGGYIDRKIYNDNESRRKQIEAEEDALEQRAYPQRMNPLWTGQSDDIDKTVNYMNVYTIWSIVMIFFAFGFIGWMWEVSLHLIKDGVFVNRGALHGPWLPIYGGGVAMIVVLLKRFRKKPLAELLAIIVLCGAVEYFTSYFMEMSRGMRWWDYTGYFLNLNGRICAEGLSVFALGGMGAVYYLVPAVDAVVSRLRRKVLIPICIGLLMLFTADLIYSHYVPNTGEGITDYQDFKENLPESGK